LLHWQFCLQNALNQFVWFASFVCCLFRNTHWSRVTIVQIRTTFSLFVDAAGLLAAPHLMIYDLKLFVPIVNRGVFLRASCPHIALRPRRVFAADFHSLHWCSKH
jgi:FtsH-binding integral membrane protein